MTEPVSGCPAMQPPKIVEVGENPRLRALAAGLLVELRPHLDIRRAHLFVHEATTQGYEILLGLDDQGMALALAGFRSLTTSRGPIILLEDLIVTLSARGRGLSRALLDRLKVIARSMSCRRIELDTGIENAHAQRVYTAYGFRPLAVHYALAV